MPLVSVPCWLLLTPMSAPALQTYTDADHQKQRPIMIHRAIFGSIERFFGILVENCGGAFPLWLAPVQCKILPITDAFVGYANEVADKMRDAGIRVEVSSGGRSPSLFCHAQPECVTRQPSGCGFQQVCLRQL